MPHPPAEHLAITSPDLSAFLPTNMSKSVVQHIVLLKVKQGVPLSQINDMIHAIRGMQGRIPGLLDVTAGANFMMERYAVSLVAPTQLLLVRSQTTSILLLDAGARASLTHFSLCWRIKPR